jgi:kynurenine 3-monooxygenase
MTEKIAIVGAGLVGCMLGCLLARRGHDVTIFEKRKNVLKSSHESAKRSTHLVVSSRGWKALDAIGASEEVIAASLPLRGRRVHLDNGDEEFLPYGSAEQSIFAIHRLTLNKILLHQCLQTPGVDVRFDERCVDIDLATETLKIEHGNAGHTYRFQADRIFGADGAFSDVKRIIADIGGIRCEEHFEAYGYKELAITPRYSAHLIQDAMHAWPRGEISFFAFPNKDSSFTATLIAPLNDAGEFKDIDSAEAFESVMSHLFPDVKSGPLTQDFLENPVSKLFSSKCSNWTVGDRVVLIGDAAHAMVPFLGQGMNAGFEDCMTVMDLLNEHSEDFAAVFGKFEDVRKADCDAITQMSADNFFELTKHVSDKHFIRKKSLERLVQHLYPDRYVPLYELVAFSDLPYGEVLRRSKELSLLATQVIEYVGGNNLADSDELDHVIRLMIDRNANGGTCEAQTH